MTLKELLDLSKGHLKDMSTLENPDFRLEQAEYDEDKGIWEIIVSYLVENTNKRNSPLSAITSEFQYYRIYKRIKIDKDQNIVGFYIYNKE